MKAWQNLRLTAASVPKYFSEAGGIGLLLEPSKLGDVDCDCEQAVRAAQVILPRTPMVHGHKSNPTSHFYYHLNSRVPGKSFVDPRSGETLVELRTNGQTNVPPTLHVPTGERIQWESEGEPIDLDGEELSARVAEVASASLLACHWPEGSRHFAAMSLAGLLLRAGWTERDTGTFIAAVAAAAQDEELASRLNDVLTTEQELEGGKPVTGAPTLAKLVGADIVEKIYEWLSLKRPVDEDPNAPIHRTDLGNARRLVAQKGEDLLFCHELGKWFIWNGHIWEADNSGEVDRFAKQTVQSIYIEAARSSGNTEREELAKHALRSESEPRLRAMMNLAKTEEGIPVSASKLDADPWLLNCANGTVDLRTGKLLPHQRNHLCTKQIPINYDSRARCRSWVVFLNRIMAEDESLIKFLQRTIGYSLTGVTTAQVLFFLYGTGANGKTTFIETIRKLLGDYAQQADFTSFLEKRTDGPRNDLARLKGARFVAAVEAGEGRKLAETIIKQVTGGDTITARFLYHEFFEYPPQFKLFLVANHKPRIAGTDEAIWRRIRLIPFDVTIPAKERDSSLLEKLKLELPGILAWAVRGCLEWQRVGLGEPVQVSRATAEYRREMDSLADFLEDCCVEGDRERANASLLYERYKLWCETNGEEVVTQKRFGTRLHEHGYEPGKKRGQRCWHGLRLRRESDEV